MQQDSGSQTSRYQYKLKGNELAHLNLSLDTESNILFTHIFFNKKIMDE